VIQRKSAGANTTDNSIEQYCSVCKKTFQMPVVEEAENNEVLRCPGCKGYLPYMVGDAKEREESAGDDEQSEFDDLALEDIDVDKAREYSERSEYDVGEVVYHRSWNDYGKVVAKETLPGNRKTIVVHFVNQGKIRLLEGVA
jgi:DNA-directed RNA polymerase subunit RPC12/RpoP